MMRYKNYMAHVEYDDKAKSFHGEIVGLRDVVTFQGSTVEDLEEAFKDSVNDYLSCCEERGEAPQKPYSGKFNLRIPPDLHAQVELRAKANGESINTFVNHALERAVG